MGTVLDAEVMDLASQDLILVPPDESVAALARRFVASSADSALVMAGDRPVGIVTENDLVRRVLAAGLSPERSRAADIMSSPVRTLPAGSRLSEAADLMSRHHLRHVPIVESGRVCGLITDRDLLMLSPVLFEAARASGDAERGARPGLDTGVCEGCGTFKADLTEADGSLLCEDCAQDSGAVPAEGSATND